MGCTDVMEVMDAKKWKRGLGVETEERQKRDRARHIPHGPECGLWGEKRNPPCHAVYVIGQDREIIFSDPFFPLLLVSPRLASPQGIRRSRGG